MSGEGNNFIRDDNRSGSKTNVSGDESTAKSTRNLNDGGASSAASGGGSAAETRGDKGRAALKEDTRVRSAMAPQDKPVLANLEITPSKFSDKALEKPNRFKELFDLDKASIYAITMKDGKEVLTARPPLKEGEKLTAGDYLISFHRKDKQLDKDDKLGKDDKLDKDNKLDKDDKQSTDRQLRVHIPKPNPANPNEPMSVLFAIHGVMPRGLSPTKFAETVPLAQEADKSEHPFIVVWPHAAKNSVGKNNDSYFWVDDNTPLPAEHVAENAKRLGYKDGDFIAALPDWVQKNTNAASHNTWSIAGHSQGAVLTNLLEQDPRLAGVFPNAFIINGTMMTDKKGNVIAGALAENSARNVVVFHPKDKIVLPEKNAAAGRAANNLLQKGLGILSNIAPAANSNTDAGLAMDNINQDPLGQIEHYRKLLGSEIDRYHQLPINNNKELKQPADFQQRVSTAANFSPDAHGPLDTIWSAESRTNGRTLTVVDTQGGHMPAGEAPGAYRGVHTAATIAYYHRQFSQQKLNSQIRENLVRTDQNKSQ
jgi:hypothetical protein